MKLELKELITKYPESLSDYKKLRGYILDLCPQYSRGLVNAVVEVAESHILDEMRSITVVKSINTSRWIGHLESEYGYSEKFAQNAIFLWCDALGKVSKQIVKHAAKSANFAVPPSSPVTKAYDPYRGQNKDDFQIKDSVLLKYVGKQSRVVIPDNVTSIGKEAFYKNTMLKEVNIPNSVTNIEYSAFYGCSGLTNMVIPNSVKYVGVSAFEGCSGITDIVISDNLNVINGFVFKDCSGLSSIIIPKNTTIIGDSAFVGCSALIKLNVKNGNVRYYSKGNCIIDKDNNKLILGCKNSIIPDDGSITDIGNYAFDGCSGLTDLSIPDSITSIGDFAFHGCVGLVDITIPEGIAYIGCKAFYNCDALKKIVVPNIPKIDWAFDFDVDIIRKDIHNGLNYDEFQIEDGVLVKYFGKQNKVIVPNNVTHIGKQAFYGCKWIDYIIIPKNVKYVDDFAFSYCVSLKSITIPPCVEVIGNFAFDHCGNLKSVIIPDSVN